MYICLIWVFFIKMKQKPMSDNTYIIINKDDIYVHIEKVPKGFNPVVCNETLNFKILDFIPVSKNVNCTINYLNLENEITFIIGNVRKSYTISQEEFDSILYMCNEKYISRIDQENLRKDKEFNDKMVKLANDYKIQCKLQ